MRARFIIVFNLFLFISITTNAQEKVWMGERITNTSIFLDPTEIQIFGSVTQIKYDESTKILNYKRPDEPNAKNNKTRNIEAVTTSRQYLPFQFGAAQSIVSRELTEKKAKAWEIFAEVGVITQFEWRHIDSIGIQRNHLNSDFRINFSYVRDFGNSSYRIRLFHVSTHLGDDFILQNGLSFAYPTKMNYEQLDFTYFKTFREKHRVYISAGSVVRPQSNRLPFSYMVGDQSNWKKESTKWGWTAGVNVKGHQATDFYPNLKVAAGTAYFSNSKDEPIRIVFEYYNGHIPYSQYEVEKVSWFGAGIYFYI